MGKKLKLNDGDPNKKSPNEPQKEEEREENQIVGGDPSEALYDEYETPLYQSDETPIDDEEEVYYDHWCPRCRDVTIFVDDVCSSCGFRKGNAPKQDDYEEDEADQSFVEDPDYEDPLEYKDGDEENDF